jgi:hypothetical protein
MARNNTSGSPAFTAPTPSMDADGTIVHVPLHHTEFGARKSQTGFNAKNDFTLKQLSNGQ